MEPEEFSAVTSAFLLVVNENFEPGAVDSFLTILRRHYPRYGEWIVLRNLLIELRKPAPASALIAESRNEDRPFAESILRFGNRNSASQDPLCHPIHELGQDFDFLASTCFLQNLNPVQVVNLLLLRTIRPAKSVAVVVTVRDEGLSLLEWIAFNRAIGLADIFVYTNDNVDGSDDLLELLALAGVIKLIRNTIGAGTDPQRKAYQHAFHLLRELRNYKWTLFLDADEFLVLDKRFDYRLDHFVRYLEDNSQGNLPGAVVFPWDWRLSDLNFEKTEGLLFERYPHSISHFMVKSMNRLSVVLGMCEVHIPTLEKGAILVDSELKEVEAKVVWGSELKSRAGGAIAHFWGKSFQEFAVKKRRGELLSLDNRTWIRDFSQYFEWTAELSEDTLRPAPSVLLQRTNQALSELNAIPGVEAAIVHIRRKYEELCRDIQESSNLKSIYNEMRSNIRPTMKPVSERG